MDREVVIVPYRDGPYLVRGPVAMRDQRGDQITLARNPIALCRCGKSRTRPFCDGTHRSINFQVPSGLERRPTSGFQGEPVDDAGESGPDREADRRRGPMSPISVPPAPEARAALGRAARAAGTLPDRAGQRIRALIIGALALLDDATPSSDRAAPMLLISGALQAATGDGIVQSPESSRAVAEMQAASTALREGR